MAKEHASVGLLCLAMESKHYNPQAITFPPEKEIQLIFTHDTMYVYTEYSCLD